MSRTNYVVRMELMRFIPGRLQPLKALNFKFLKRVVSCHQPQQLA